MKTIIFVMALWVNGELFEPPYKEVMPSLTDCQAKVINALNTYERTNEAFTFTAGCSILSTKADPS